MNLKSSLFALTFLCFITPAQADWQESLNKAWDHTKDISDTTINKTRDLYENLSGDVHLVDKNERQVITPDLILNEKKEHLQTIWPDVLEKLDKALVLNSKIDTAPASSWFGDDKKSLYADQIDVFSLLEKLFENPAIAKNRKNINRLREKINEKRKAIARLKEQRIIATGSTKHSLDKDIKEIDAEIAELDANVSYQKQNLIARLQEMGLSMNQKQVDVLLSRVDSDDIIKMSLVYDVLADITRQLLALTQEFNEDINQARKYYGMHVVLLKMVMTMQQNYINKLEQLYLPKIQQIRRQTRQLSHESKALLRNEKNPAQRRVLKNNLKAQQLTLNVATLYAQQLQQQKQKVSNALNQAKKEYRVAKNTFDTVKLSADLIRLMKTNQASFNALMHIQIPEIVPFKNLAMQKKFEELSALLRQ